MDNTKKIKPIVSIVIPCHNEAQWLLECVESLIDQTEKRLEIIIIDDGSGDESKMVARKIMARYGEDKIKFFSFEKNKGEGSARNKGVALASGEYIIQTDADAVFPTEFVEKSLKILETKKVDTLSLGELRVHPKRKGILANYWKAKRKATYLLRTEGKREEVAGIYFYRKKLWQDLGGYFEKTPLSTDFDFCMRSKEFGAKNFWAKELYFFHADPVNWKVFFMRLYNGARFSVPMQKKWNRWLNKKEQTKELAQFAFTIILFVLGFMGFSSPTYFLSWALLIAILGLSPIILHQETKMILKVCWKEKFLSTIALLPFINIIRVTASNFGKVFAIVFYHKVLEAVTFDVSDIEKGK